VEDAPLRAHEEQHEDDLLVLTRTAQLLELDHRIAAREPQHGLLESLLVLLQDHACHHREFG